MQLPASRERDSAGAGSRRPTGTPSTRRSGAEPKFARTRTPSVASASGTTRLAVPIPPFQSKQTIPVPAPTAPSPTAPSVAAATARPASSASTWTIALSDSQLSSHSATSGMTTSVVPDGRVRGDRGGDGAVEDPADRHRRGQVERRLHQPPLRGRDEAGHLPGAVEHRGARGTGSANSPSGGPGRIAVTPVRAIPPAAGLVAPHGDVADAHAGDVGDRVRRAGVVAADPQAEVAQARAAWGGSGHAPRPLYARRAWPRCRSCGATTTASTCRAARAVARGRHAGGRAARPARTRSAAELTAAGHPVVAAQPQPDAALEAVHDRALLDFLAGAYDAWTAAGPARGPGPARGAAVLLRPPGAARPARARAAGRDLGAHGRVRVRHHDADRPGHVAGGPRRAPTPRSPPSTSSSAARPPPTPAPARPATT